MNDSYTVTNETAGTNQPYSRARLSTSIQRACAHLSGPALYSAVDALTDNAEKDIIANAYYGQLSSDELGMLVYDMLNRYDPVAGVQYAAQNGLVSAISQRKRGRPSLK